MPKFVLDGYKHEAPVSLSLRVGLAGEIQLIAYVLGAGENAILAVTKDGVINRFFAVQPEFGFQTEADGRVKVAQ